MKAKQYRRVSGFGSSPIWANLSPISAIKQLCLLKISPRTCGCSKYSVHSQYFDQRWRWLWYHDRAEFDQEQNRTGLVFLLWGQDQARGTGHPDKWMVTIWEGTQCIPLRYKAQIRIQREFQNITLKCSLYYTPSKLFKWYFITIEADLQIKYYSND